MQKIHEIHKEVMFFNHWKSDFIKNSGILQLRGTLKIRDIFKIKMNFGIIGFGLYRSATQKVPTEFGLEERH